MTEKEKSTVLKSFNKIWNDLDMSNSTPCIAFIKRKDLAKNYLPNIEEIINSVGQVELVYLVSKITDSKYPVIRKYSNISSLYLSVITMPSYREIKNNEFIIKDKPKAVVTTVTRETYQEEKVQKETFNFNYKNAYSYGNANVLALTGLLLITLGLTLTIILKVLGG